MAERRFGRFGKDREQGDQHEELPAGEQRPQIGRGPGGEVLVPGTPTSGLSQERRAQYAQVGAERSAAQTRMDVDFFMDATGSMAPLIEDAKRSVALIIQHLLQDEGINLSLRLGIYRDYPKGDDIFQVSERTDDPSVLLDWLGPIQAFGGQRLVPGDEEAVEYALARTEGILVIVAGDSPSHKKHQILDLGDYVQDTRTAVEIARELGAKGIPIYPLVVPRPNGPDPATVQDFEEIGRVSGGASGILDGGEALMQMIAMAILKQAKGLQAVAAFAGRLQLTAGARAFADRLQIGPGRR